MTMGESVRFWCVLTLVVTCWNLVLAFNLSPQSRVVITDPARQKGSYFGYTVLLRTEYESYSASIVVGAPRGNASLPAYRRIAEPGVVYQCNIDVNARPICYPLLLDKTGDSLYSADSAMSYRHRKYHSWLGATVTGLDSRGGRFVACAPRWVNQHFRGYYLSNGLCYSLRNTKDANHTAEILIPTLNSKLQSWTAKNISYFYYAYAQAGFSAHLVKPEGTELLLGAPGLVSWAGGVVLYKDVVNDDDDESDDILDFPDPIIPNTYFNKYVGLDGYFGYAVSSGRFEAASDKTWYVAGAPRDAKYKGRVSLFDIRDPVRFENHEILMKKVLEGEQMGEYFGSTVCVVDVNGDKLDDVIVGAPRYTIASEADNTGDEGAVYVFINHNDWLFSTAKLNSKEKPGAQFGTAISGLGDLNRDGFQDVVVGAPYEDFGRGAIYIYLGNAKGLGPQYSQHIPASSLYPGLRGFGCSVSTGLDIDHNHYVDLAVGSFTSGHAVLVKSQPVAELTGTIRAHVKSIDLRTRQFNATACVEYNGKDVPAMANVTVEVGADMLSRRLVLVGVPGPPTAVTERNYTLQIGKSVCEVFVMKVRLGQLDFAKPIELTLRYRLLPDPAGLVKFCATCPVVDPNAPTAATALVPYASGCRQDGACQPDLGVVAYFLGITHSTPLVIGAVDSVSLNVSVWNHGEPAFLSRLLVTVPAELPLLELPDGCYETEAGSVQCDLGNILTKTEERSVLFEFDARDLPSGSDMVIIEVNVTSSGEEQEQKDNRIVMELPLKTIASLEIRAKSNPEQIQYKDKENVIVITQPDFSQDFEITNVGPSAIDHSMVKFDIPFAYDGVPLFRIYKPKAYLDKDSIICTASAPGFYVDPIIGEEEILKPEMQENGTRRRRSVDTAKYFTALSSSDDTIDGDEETSGTIHGWPVNRTMALTCSKTNTAVSCMNILCQVRTKHLADHVAAISFAIQAQINEIEKVLVKKDIVLIESRASVFTTIKIHANGTGKGRARIYTTLHGFLPEETVSVWMIALFIIVGLLILVLIVGGLVKFGFFKRSTKEEMELLKEQNAGTEILIVESEEEDSDSVCEK